MADFAGHPEENRHEDRDDERLDDHRRRVPAAVPGLDRLHELRVFNRHVNRATRRIEAAIGQATDAGNTDLAARLQTQRDRLEARQDRIRAPAAAIRDRVEDRGAPADGPAS